MREVSKPQKERRWLKRACDNCGGVLASRTLNTKHYLACGWCGKKQKR